MATSKARCDGCKPGWCNRHQVEKTPKLVELCGDETRPGYFAAWEGGYGPMQETTLLGDRVAKVITAATRGKVKPCGECKGRQSALNKIGQSIGIGSDGVL